MTLQQMNEKKMKKVKDVSSNHGKEKILLHVNGIPNNGERERETAREREREREREGEKRHLPHCDRVAQFVVNSEKVVVAITS